MLVRCFWDITLLINRHNRAGLLCTQRFAPAFNRHDDAAQADKGEFQMTDNVQKNQGQNPGQSGQQSGQQQQKNPQDVSKKDPSQDRNKEQDDRQGQKDQGGQRRAS